MWLYRIATNACLDALAAHPRRVLAGEASNATAQLGGSSNPAEISWLQPYPDRLLEGIASDDADPEAAIVAREGRVRLANPAEVPVTRYRYRGPQIPTPWTSTTQAAS